MKGKLLFAMILFTLPLMGQTYLSGSDSLSWYAPASKYVKIGVTDSADTHVDTLKVYVKMYGGSYQLVGCQNLLTGDIETELIAGDGETGRWLVNEPFPTSIMVERTNTLARGRRTIIWLSASGSY